MNKLLILGLVLCFTGTASASVVTITAVTGEGDDADPLTSWLEIPVEVGGGGGIVGIDIGIKDPDGISGGNSVCWTDDVILGGAGVDDHVTYAAMKAAGLGDDREGFISTIFVVPGMDDGVVAYSGTNPPYTYDIQPQPDPMFPEPNAFISGAILDGSLVNGLVGRLGCDGMSAAQLCSALRAMGDPNIPGQGAVFIGPGGIALSDGYTVDQIIWRQPGCSILEPTTCAEVWSMGYGMQTDLDQSCKIDWGDFSVFASQWLWCNDPLNPGQCSDYYYWIDPIPADCEEVQEYGYRLPADFNQDCYVNWKDFSHFASMWLDCNDPEGLPPCIPDCW